MTKSLQTHKKIISFSEKKALIEKGLKKSGLYGVKLAFLILFLTLIFSYATYNILEKYLPENFAVINIAKDKIYILKSDSTLKLFLKYGISQDIYEDRLQKFANLLKELSYKTVFIEEKDIDKLHSNDKLALIDTLALREKTALKIKDFVKNGGKIIFNYNIAFSNENAKFIGDRFLNSITKLKFNNEYNYINLKKEGGYLSVKILSPITKFNPNGKRMDLILYDNIPIFTSPDNLKPDAILTNYTQSQTPIIENKFDMLSIKKAGAVWHGEYGDGKWVYFSFPSYALFEAKESAKSFKNLIKGMLNYLNNDVIIRKYPFIDAKNAIFVSEDTEYKFENLLHFSNLSQKYKIPVTAFLVGFLAKEYQDIVKEASKNPFLEFGSHSYSHKKIVGNSESYIKKEIIGSKNLIEKISNKKVFGFRPPREEIDNKMRYYLKKGGYRYVLEQEKDYLLPYKNEELMTIPRHGVDDYTYLMNLDWDSGEILSHIIKEANVLKYLNGIYTLSIHTHLIAYGSNIKILEDFFKFLKSHKDFTALNGYGIYKRLKLNQNIDLLKTVSAKNIIVTIKNNNKEEVKNFTFKIFPSKKLVLKTITSEISGIKIIFKKQNDGNYIVKIGSLKPKSSLTLFISYEKRG